MVERWITLANLPTSGREFSFEDQEVWEALWSDARYDMRALVPLVATFSVLPQPEGVLVRGTLSGSVETPCHRCTEPANIELHHDFDIFEAHEDTDVLDGEEDARLRLVGPEWELNIAALLWEEFVLAIPEKILCADMCLGLCPHCGKNRNMDPCACASSERTSPLVVALQRARTKTT